MFHTIGNGGFEVRVNNTTAGPSHVTFVFSESRKVEIPTASYQILRRGVYREHQSHTVHTIKALRDLKPELGLKEAKDIVEWFEANFTTEAK